MTPFNFEQFVPSIRNAAAATLPNECCGFIVSTGNGYILRPVKNIASDPINFFEMPEEAATQAEKLGEIIAIYHSHPGTGSAEFSEADLAMFEETQVPWIIVCPDNDEFRIKVPEGWTWPLLGRPFIYGEMDCYNLARDYFNRKHGLALNDYDHLKSGWWESGEVNLYVDNFEKEGFVEVTGNPKEDDVLLMRVGKTAVPNHVAVYIGSNVMLHHMLGRSSEKTICGSYWKTRTVKILRHKSLC